MYTKHLPTIHSILKNLQYRQKRDFQLKGKGLPVKNRRVKNALMRSKNYPEYIDINKIAQRAMRMNAFPLGLDSPEEIVQYLNRTAIRYGFKK